MSESKTFPDEELRQRLSSTAKDLHGVPSLPLAPLAMRVDVPIVRRDAQPQTRPGSRPAMQIGNMADETDQIDPIHAAPRASPASSALTTSVK